MFAGFFPDGCPPDDAGDLTGDVYRLVDGNPPSDWDFQSKHQRSQSLSKAGDCLACGLSILRSWTDAERLKQRIPGMRKKSIAVGIIPEPLGKTKATPTRNQAGHHTWWVPDGVEVKVLFTVIEP